MSNAIAKAKGTSNNTHIEFNPMGLLEGIDISQVTIEQLNEWHKEAEQAKGKAFKCGLDYLAYIYRLGEALHQKKEGLGHGNWEDWVEGNMIFTPATARNYMRFAKSLDDSDLLQNENAFSFSTQPEQEELEKKLRSFLPWSKKTKKPKTTDEKLKKGLAGTKRLAGELEGVAPDELHSEIKQVIKSLQVLLPEQAPTTPKQPPPNVELQLAEMQTPPGVGVIAAPVAPLAATPKDATKPSTQVFPSPETQPVEHVALAGGEAVVDDFVEPTTDELSLAPHSPKELPEYLDTNESKIEDTPSSPAQSLGDLLSGMLRTIDAFVRVAEQVPDEEHQVESIEKQLQEFKGLWKRIVVIFPALKANQQPKGKTIKNLEVASSVSVEMSAGLTSATPADVTNKVEESDPSAGVSDSPELSPDFQRVEESEVPNLQGVAKRVGRLKTQSGWEFLHNDLDANEIIELVGLAGIKNQIDLELLEKKEVKSCWNKEFRELVIDALKVLEFDPATIVDIGTLVEELRNKSLASFQDDEDFMPEHEA